ncbi:MAG: BrnT family toxin [Pseudomonadales bacterium]
MDIEFEWDKRKASTNRKKHGITFEEAKTAFFDEAAIVYHDPDHSEDEERFLLLGNSFKLNTVVVCHCIREGESKIRIISARKADKSETSDYWDSRK